MKRWRPISRDSAPPPRYARCRAPTPGADHPGYIVPPTPRASLEPPNSKPKKSCAIDPRIDRAPSHLRDPRRRPPRDPNLPARLTRLSFRSLSTRTDSGRSCAPPATSSPSRVHPRRRGRLAEARRRRRAGRPPQRGRQDPPRARAVPRHVRADRGGLRARHRGHVPRRVRREREEGRERALHAAAAGPRADAERDGRRRTRVRVQRAGTAGGDVHDRGLRGRVHVGGGAAGTAERGCAVATGQAGDAPHVQRAAETAEQDGGHGAPRQGFAPVVVAVPAVRAVGAEPGRELQRGEHHRAG